MNIYKKDPDDDQNPEKTPIRHVDASADKPVERKTMSSKELAGIIHEVNSHARKNNPIARQVQDSNKLPGSTDPSFPTNHIFDSKEERNGPKTGKIDNKPDPKKFLMANLALQMKNKSSKDPWVAHNAKQVMKEQMPKIGLADRVKLHAGHAAERIKNAHNSFKEKVHVPIGVGSKKSAGGAAPMKAKVEGASPLPGVNTGLTGGEAKSKTPTKKALEEVNDIIKGEARRRKQFAEA